MAGLYIGDTPINKVRIGVFSENGIDTSDATATASDMKKGATAYVNGEKVTGTVNELGGSTISIENAHQANDPTFGDRPDNVIGNAILTGYTRSGDVLLRDGYTTDLFIPAETFGDATESDVVSGKTFTSVTGLKLTGTHVCSGGIDTSDATATASDIAKDKTAYVNGEKVTGSVPVITSGSFQSFSSPAIVPSYDSSNGRIMLETSYTSDSLVRSNSSIRIGSDASNFGDATADDVAEGKTFTSSSGLLVTGTHVCSGGSVSSDNNCEAYHITSTSDTISFNGTGTVKVWGYGYKSSGTYTKTTYAFCGDGYYTSSLYGTPTKTTATFSVSNGTLSGLPSGLTTIDVIVTIGI